MKPQFISTNGFCWLISITVLAQLSSPLAAQTLEEVVVTAQKRAESIQDVPISIATFSGAQIEDLAIGDLRELIEYVPGVELFDDRGVSSQPTWIIRGVGLADFNANNTPTAAIYYDEFYLTSNVMGGIGMFDIERVEVLKGAQGGLYGRNTTGGAIRVHSKRASLEKSSGYVTGSYGRYDSYSLEGAFGAPIGESAAFRISAMTNQGGGYQDSLATIGDDNYGDRDFWAVRGQLLFEPTDKLSLLVKVDGGQDDSETLLGEGVGAYDLAASGIAGFPVKCAAILTGSQDPSTCVTWATLTNAIAAVPLGPLASDQSGDGKVVLANPINKLNNDWLSVTAQIDYDMDFATLTAITGYIDYENKQAFDYDGGQLDTGHEFNTSPITSWSQELRLISNDDGGPLSWLAGVIYAEDELNEARTFTFSDNFLIFPGTPDADRGFDQKTESWAIYGQLGYHLNEQWKIHGSLRYTEEDKTIRNAFSDLNLPDGSTAVFFVPPFSTKDYNLDENWSGHVGIDWTPSDYAMIYGKVTRGFKSGGFFGGFFLSDPELEPYREETVWSYELGFKSDWLDKSLRVNGALFYYDYSDVQGFTSVFSTVTNTVLTKLGNVGDAEHVGFEMDITWLPQAINGLSLTGGFAILDAELDSSDIFLAQDFVTVVSRDGLDRPSPEFSYFITGRYEWSLSAALAASAQLTYSWRDDQARRSSLGTDIDAALFGIGSYGVLNARVQAGADDGRWNVAFVVKNLTDENYLASATFDNLGSYMHTYGRPLSWTIELNYNWE